MGDGWLRKLLWGFLGFGALVFMIGFGSCAALGFSFGIAELTNPGGTKMHSLWSMKVLGLAIMGSGLAWGFCWLAFYCHRKMKTPGADDTAKAESP